MKQKRQPTSMPILWRPKSDDPFDDITPVDDGYERQQMVPPEGASEGDDPHSIEQYTTEQFLFSISSFCDTAWPVSPEPELP